MICLNGFSKYTFWGEMFIYRESSSESHKDTKQKHFIPLRPYTFPSIHMFVKLDVQSSRICLLALNEYSNHTTELA